MARTIIGLNDPKAVKRWSTALAVDVGRESYFTRRFMGRGTSARTPIHILMELENDAGEQITYDLSLQLKMQPIEGDELLHNNEEKLNFYTDNVYIDQMRGGVNTGGRMTRKRTLHNLRTIARRRQSEWWARVYDELFFMYLSGARGIADNWVFPTSYTGFANNSLQAPDANHLRLPGAKVKATLVAADVMDLALIDKVKTHADTMGGGTEELPEMMPVRIDGEDHYVLVMHPWNLYDLRTATSAGQWLDIQKAAAGAEGRRNPIFQGGAGMYNDVILHSHKAVVRFNDYGGSAVQASRSLFMGTQAGVVAFGSPGTGLRFDWNEETRDNGNQVVISTNSIFGVKKTRFNSVDFGVIAVDSAAKEPGT